MEILRNTGDVTFRLVVSQNGEEFYDLGIEVDPSLLNMAQLDAVESILRRFGRRIAADWSGRRF
jgi:hypothetical protein